MHSYYLTISQRGRFESAMSAIDAYSATSSRHRSNEIKLSFFPGGDGNILDAWSNENLRRLYDSVSNRIDNIGAVSLRLSTEENVAWHNLVMDEFSRFVRKNFHKQDQDGGSNDIVSTTGGEGEEYEHQAKRRKRCLTSSSSTGGCCALKHVRIKGWDHHIAPSIIRDIASIIGLESFEYDILTGYNGNAHVPRNFYTPLLQCNTLERLTIDTGFMHVTSNLDALRMLVSGLYNKNDNAKINGTFVVSNLQHLTLQLRHARSYTFFSDPSWSFVMEVVKMIGHNGTLKTITIDSNCFLSSHDNDRNGRRRRRINLIDDDSERKNKNCDVLWKELATSLEHNNTLQSLALPIHPIDSQPTDDGNEKAHSALVNALKHKNYTITEVFASPKVLRDDTLIEAFGENSSQVSLFGGSHEVQTSMSRALECYLDMNRRGRDAFGFTQTCDSGDAVGPKLPVAGSSRRILEPNDWIQILSQNGNSKYDLDWLYYASRCNPTALVWLRDSLTIVDRKKRKRVHVVDDDKAKAAAVAVSTSDASPEWSCFGRPSKRMRGFWFPPLNIDNVTAVNPIPTNGRRQRRTKRDRTGQRPPVLRRSKRLIAQTLAAAAAVTTAQNFQPNNVDASRRSSSECKKRKRN